MALITRYSPDEMNNSPNFEEKKKFLTIFNLTHISAEKRKGRVGLAMGRAYWKLLKQQVGPIDSWGRPKPSSQAELKNT